MKSKMTFYTSTHALRQMRLLGMIVGSTRLEQLVSADCPLISLFAVQYSCRLESFWKTANGGIAIYLMRRNKINYSFHMIGGVI